MKVTINEDMVSATCKDGVSYPIAGLIIKKPKSYDAYYELDEPFCKSVIWKGHEHNADLRPDGTIDIY